MKKQFLKIAGVKSEQEFYNKYPTEEDFFKAHPEALKQLARGGEAFPQIATMDNFFTYGSPVPPTYYAHGGAFPMAQSEEQFFSPYYGNIPNPYNKAMGGSYDEAHNEAMSFPYGNTGPSTHFMMQDGGYMPEEEPLPRMGVKGYLTDFIGAVKNTAAKKINDNLALHGAVKNPEQYDFEQARYGGNLKTYQSATTSAAPKYDLSKATVGPLPQMDAKQAYDFYRQSSPAANQNSDKTVSYNDPNSDKGTTNSTSSTNPSGSSVVNNYYYGSQDPQNRNYNSNPYANTRVRGSFGRYNQPLYTDKKAMDALGVSHFNINTPKTALGRFFRPTTIDYYRDVPGGQGSGTGSGATGQQTPGATGTQGAGQQDPGKGMGFFGRLFNKPGNIVPQPGSTTNVSPNQQVAGDARISQRNNQMWNPEFTDWRNQSMQNRLGRINTKLDNLEAHEAWQQKQLGNENIELSGWRGRQRDRLLNRAGNIENKMTNYKGYLPPKQKYGGLIQYQSKDTQGTVKLPDGREVPVANQKFNDKTAFKKSMTVDEYLRSRSTSPELQEQIKVSNQQGNPTIQLIENQQPGVVIDRGTPQWRPGQPTPVATKPVSSDMVPAFNSANPAHRKIMMQSIISGMTDDSYDNLLDYNLENIENKKHGGSYNAGDVVDMTPEEIQRFIAMGGQVEFLD